MLLHKGEKMHVGEISFCDKIAFNIKSEDTKRFILDALEKKYRLRIIHKHYDKFDEKSVPILQKNPHLACVRSNGNPYFLYLMKYNFIQYSIFIDKKIQHGYYLPRMIIVQLMFDDTLFNDTIFEGEMIKANDGKWYFLINDLLVSSGNQLHDINLPRRISMCYDMLAKHYVHEEYDLFRIGVKTFFKYDKLEYVVKEHIPSLPYTCRGIYFKPLFIRFKDILYNFNDDLIKKVERVKYKTMKQFILKDDQIDDMKHKLHTMSCSEGSSSSSEIDFPVININTNTPKPPQTTDTSLATRKFSVRKTSTPDVYELFDGQTMIGTVCVPTMKISKKMRELTLTMNMVDKTEVLCEFSHKFNKWMPVL